MIETKDPLIELKKELINKKRNGEKIIRIKINRRTKCFSYICKITNIRIFFMCFRNGFYTADICFPGENSPDSYGRSDKNEVSQWIDKKYYNYVMEL